MGRIFAVSSYNDRDHYFELLRDARDAEGPDDEVRGCFPASECNRLAELLDESTRRSDELLVALKGMIETAGPDQTERLEYKVAVNLLHKIDPSYADYLDL